MPRVLLFPVDDTDDSQKSWDWMIKNFYQDGDEINREAYEGAVRKAEAFIVKRFLARLPEHIQTTPIVHIIKSEVDTNNVGHVICVKAEELKAACVLMGSHNKGPVAEFFLGSVSQYVSHHCKVPVVIVKQP